MFRSWSRRIGFGLGRVLIAFMRIGFIGFMRMIALFAASLLCLASALPDQVGGRVHLGTCMSTWVSIRGDIHPCLRRLCQSIHDRHHASQPMTPCMKYSRHACVVTMAMTPHIVRMRIRPAASPVACMVVYNLMLYQSILPADILGYSSPMSHPSRLRTTVRRHIPCSRESGRRWPMMNGGSCPAATAPWGIPSSATAPA